MIKECFYCKTTFQTGSNRAKYCSHKCQLAFNREQGKEKRQQMKAKKETKELTKKSKCLSEKVAQANAKGISYGTLAAKEQAKSVKIERKQMVAKKPKKEMPVKTKVSYEYRKIQFQEMVQQYLFNEEGELWTDEKRKLPLIY